MAAPRGSGAGFAPISRADAANYSSSSDDDADLEDEYRLPETTYRDDPDSVPLSHNRKRKYRHDPDKQKERAALGIFGSESEDEGPRGRWKDRPLRSKGVAFVPTSSMQPTLNPDVAEDTPTHAATGPSAFGKQGKMSFAQRQMMKMGWKQGEGLGKERQGRNTAIEANLRPMGLGLGAVKEKSDQERKEEKRQAAIRGETVVDSDEEKKPAKKLRTAKQAGVLSAQGSGTSTPRQQKPKFLTKADMEKSGMKVPEVFAQILDMTGPGQRTITAGSGLMTPTHAQPMDQESVERRKLNERAYADLKAYKQEFDDLTVRKRLLDLQVDEDSDILGQGRDKLEAHRNFERLATDLSNIAAQPDLAPRDKWNQVAEKLTGCHPVEDELPELAISILGPIMQLSAIDWDVLNEPTRFADEISLLQDVLEVSYPSELELQKLHETEPHIHGIHRPRKATTCYETMLYKIWFPKVLGALKDWDARDPRPMLELFDAWNKLLPPFIRSQLLENIARKLDEAIKQWKPRRHTQRSMPHDWIFCWLPHLPEHQIDPMSKTGLVADVKRKWRSVIDHWDLQDGVISGLLEWKLKLSAQSNSSGAKTRDAWQQLTLNHLIPRLGRYLRRHFDVEPSNQREYLDVLSDVLLWDGVLSARAIGELIAVELFPRFHDVLYEWLVSPEPDYEEIADWLKWWFEEAIPPELLTLPSIITEYDKAITTVNQALVLGDAARYHLPRPGKSSKQEVKKKDPAPAAQPEGPAEPASFRNMLEDFCTNNDYQFIPLRNNASKEGHPVFRITARTDGRGGLTGWFVTERQFLAQTPGGAHVIDENGLSTLHAYLEG